MHIRSKNFLVAAALSLAALAGTPARAQDYPSKPITIVVPFAPGSGTDQMARMMAQIITNEYKIPVLVDDRAGASGFIAAQYVAKAAPDGYTVLLVTPASPVQSVGDLIAMARKPPGELHFGSGSSSSRVAGELFRQMT